MTGVFNSAPASQTPPGGYLDRSACCYLSIRDPGQGRQQSEPVAVVLSARKVRCHGAPSDRTAATGNAITRVITII